MLWSHFFCTCNTASLLLGPPKVLSPCDICGVPAMPRGPHAPRCERRHGQEYTHFADFGQDYTHCVSGMHLL